MNDLRILPGEKFAIVAIPGALPHGSLKMFPMRLTDDLWALTKLPVSLANHWGEWLGSIRASEISEASLLLLAKRRSKTPQVLDLDTQTLERLVTQFYWGALAVGPLICSKAPTLVQGGCSEESCNVRQVGWMPRPHLTLGTVSGAVDHAWLAESATIAEAFERMPPGSFKRIYRALNAFFTANTTQNVYERLHQFVRCIDGFIQGGTAHRFASRAELFVGPGHYEGMRAIYDLRSQIEHLNDLDPVLAGATERERQITFLKQVLVAENVARHCVRRFFADQQLSSNFFEDAAVTAFWEKGGESQRKIAWGVPFDLAGYLHKIADLQISHF